ncbi:predicted protein, partial [Nematostella vectensis]
MTWYINSCLQTDLFDIEKSYMYNKGSCMWVAEYDSNVVGMVGLVHSENHPEEVAELQRMSVSSSVRRKGIARKLIFELLEFAREYGYRKIILTTSILQPVARTMYRKLGFQVVREY